MREDEAEAATARPDGVRLPWDVSLSPGAYFRTGWVWLVRPRHSRRTYAADGSRLRAVLFAALTLTLAFFSASTVRDSLSAPAREQEAVSPALMLVHDLAEWQVHSFYALVLLALSTLVLDWLFLQRRSAPGALVRAWAFGLAASWTLWLAVPLAWTAGPLSASGSGQERTAGALLAYLVFLGSVALVPLWFWLRWWLLPWAAGPSRLTRAVALLSPWVPILVVALLDRR
jgi:hypothetical protein